MGDLKHYFKNGIYSYWERERLPVQSLYVMALIFVLHIFGGALEFSAYDYELAKAHAVLRLMGLCFVILCLCVMTLCLRPNFGYKFLVANCVVVAITCSTYLLYLKFLLDTNGSQNVLVITACVTIISAALLANFRIAFFAYTVICLGISIVFMHSFGEFHSQFRVLIQVFFATFVSMSLTNTLKNIQIVESKYLQIMSISNEWVAKVAVTSNKSINEIEELKAKKRPLAVLIADWRGFQSLTESLPAEEVAKIMKSFYDKAYGILNDLKINDAQLNWFGGDTLVGTFFSKTEDKNEIIFNSLKYAQMLVNTLPEHVFKETGFQIDFDVGLAYGEDSIFGILGPSHDVKMAVAGAIPGRAARYEAEAKAIRKRNLIKSAESKLDIRPTIVCDTVFANLAQILNLKCTVSNIEASQKDIVGAQVTHIQFSKVS